MSSEIKIYAVEVFNLNSEGMFCGEPVPKGCLGVHLDRNPRFMYQQIGNCFVAHDGGLVSCYELKAGTNKGFAGRPITLPVTGQGKVFKNKGVTHKTFVGSLWDTSVATKAASDLLGEPVRRVGIRARLDKTYFSCLATRSFLNRLSRVVVLGEPEQSPLI